MPFSDPTENVITPPAPPEASGYSKKAIFVGLGVLLAFVGMIMFGLHKKAEQQAQEKKQGQGIATSAMTTLAKGVSGHKQEQVQTSLPVFVSNMDMKRSQGGLIDIANTHQKPSDKEKELKKRREASLVMKVEGNDPVEKHKKENDQMFASTASPPMPQNNVPQGFQNIGSTPDNIKGPSEQDMQKEIKGTLASLPSSTGGPGSEGGGPGYGMGMNGMAMPTISPTNPSPDKLAASENKWANKTHDKASLITTTPMVPSTPYFLNAGHIIPAVLNSEINTDNPGMVQAVVTHDVYNDNPGHENEILIPSGSSLVGKYNNTVNFGQTRVQVQWTQVTLPTGTVLPIKGEGEAKTGASGFHDGVNNHYLKIFGGVMLLTLMDTGPMLATPSSSTSQLSGGGVESTMGQSLGMNASQIGMQYSSNLMNLAPTLTIRNGYPFNVVIPSTVTFPNYYSTVYSEK